MEYFYFVYFTYIIYRDGIGLGLNLIKPDLYASSPNEYIYNFH